MNKVVNLTAHTINEVTTGSSFPTSGIVARVKQETKKVATCGEGIPIYSSILGEIEGLPAPQKDTIYIVSGLTLSAVPANRTDVVAPGNVCRDENKKPIGCTGFRANT